MCYMVGGSLRFRGWGLILKGDNYYISIPKPDSGGIYSTKLYWAYIMGSRGTAENKATC